MRHFIDVSFPWPIPGLGWAVLALLVYPLKVLYTRYADKVSTALEHALIRQKLLGSLRIRQASVSVSTAWAGKSFALEGRAFITNLLHIGNVIEGVEAVIEGKRYKLTWEPKSSLSANETRIIQVRTPEIPWPKGLEFNVELEVRDMFSRTYRVDIKHDLSSHAA